MARYHPKRSVDPAPEIPTGLQVANPGPRPDPPKLEFRGTSWKIYYRRKWKSLKLPKEARTTAAKLFDAFKASVHAGDEERARPGEMLFKTMIGLRLAFLAATAVTPKKLTYLAQTQIDSVWWLRFFGNKKLKHYRAKDSDLYQKWYVKQRAEFYRKHPWSRKQAANGAVYSLQHLKRFCKNFAEDEETGWYPNIKVPEKVDVPAGRILERWEQARLLLACMGGVYDREKDCWKTRTYTDAQGVKRVTSRIRSKRVIAGRKGYSRVLRVGVCTGVREEVYGEVVWGRHKVLAHFDVDDEGAGDFRRRGTKVPDSNKTRPTSPVPNRLKRHLRVWMYEDGQSARMIGEGGKKRKHVRGEKQKHVFRKIDGTYYCRIDLRGIVRDAGLDPDVTEHALRYTAVEEAHQQRLSLEDAAEVLGMSQETLLSHYTDWARRAGASRKQVLKAVNSRTAAKLLRKPHAKAGPGDRKRNYARRAAQLARKLEKSVA